MVDAMALHGVLIGTIDVDTLRLVTHKDVDDEDVERVVTALDALAVAAAEQH